MFGLSDNHIANDKDLFYFGVCCAGFWPLQAASSLQNPCASAGGFIVNDKFYLSFTIISYTSYDSALVEYMSELNKIIHEINALYYIKYIHYPLIIHRSVTVEGYFIYYFWNHGFSNYEFISRMENREDEADDKRRF